MNDFDIRPYVGVGPLAFGMKPEEVHALVGEPRMQGSNPLGGGTSGMRAFVFVTPPTLT